MGEHTVFLTAPDMVEDNDAHRRHALAIAESAATSEENRANVEAVVGQQAILTLITSVMNERGDTGTSMRTGT